MIVSCPVCSAARFERTRLLSGLSVFACVACGFLVSEIEPAGPIRPEYERVRRDVYHRSVGAVRHKQAALVLALVRKHGAGGREWLDVGCGFGFLLGEAHRAGYAVSGVEPDAGACASAREIDRSVSIHQGVLSDDVMPDDSLAIISTMDVLEHVPAGELVDFARMVRRKLRPGGLWVIKVPTTEGIFYQTCQALAGWFRRPLSGAIKRLWQVEYEFPHTVYFNSRTLETFLERSGFECVASRYLEEVSAGLIRDRLLMDDTFSRLAAVALAPVALLLSLVDSVRRKSDALLVLARRRDP